MSPTRRLLVALPLLLVLLALAGCETLNTVSGYLGNKVVFTEPQLQRYLGKRFPREIDKLGGLVSVTLSQPSLKLPQDDDRLHLGFDVAIGALGSKNLTQGNFALASGLRYDPATQGLHLDNPEVINVHLDGANGLLQGSSRELVNLMLAELAREVPVYRLDDDLLRKLPASKQIGTVRIQGGTVVVELD